jgi:transcriptional regulator of arginine metabolism
MTSRIEALRKLLSQGKLSTQDELREELESLSFKVTQSTISRDLRRLGAVKAVDPQGRTVYRLPEEASMPVAATASLRDLIIDIRTNGSIVVLHTTPGSASLVARHLDHVRPGGILGTIAGDDTIFVAPADLSARELKATIRAIQESFDQLS